MAIVSKKSAVQLDCAESVNVTEKVTIPATQLTESRNAPSVDAQSDSRHSAGAISAVGQVQATKPANPQSSASKLNGLVDEVIDCICLESTPEGGSKVVAPLSALTRIKKARKWKKYLLSGPVDLFDSSVSFDVIRMVLSPLWKAQESEFRICTSYPERMHDYAEWEKAQYDLWHFPINLTISVPVQSVLELQRLDHFAEVRHELKSVLFSGFVSDPLHPLAPGDVLPRLLHCDLREILVDGEHLRPGKNLTRADADCMNFIAGESVLGGCVVAL